MQIPTAYRETTIWRPRIGDIFPKFTVATTQGEKNFWSWAEGSWSLLFAQPSAFTPVCTAELVAFAKAQPAFSGQNIQLMSISGSSVQEQIEWREATEDYFDVDIDFPGAEDPALKLAKCFGMLHPKEAADFMIRKTFVIDPSLKIRAILEYPIDVARDPDEMLRLVSNLQAQDRAALNGGADISQNQWIRAAELLNGKNMLSRVSPEIA